MERLERRHNSSSQERILQESGRPERGHIFHARLYLGVKRLKVDGLAPVRSERNLDGSSRSSAGTFPTELKGEFLGKIEFFKVHENAGNGRLSSL